MMNTSLSLWLRIHTNCASYVTPTLLRWVETMKIKWHVSGGMSHSEIMNLFAVLMQSIWTDTGCPSNIFWYQ
jgi:hypothetical protein